MWVTKAPTANSHLIEPDREGLGHTPSAWNGQVLEFSFYGCLIIGAVGGDSWNLEINGVHDSASLEPSYLHTNQSLRHS